MPRACVPPMLVDKSTKKRLRVQRLRRIEPLLARDIVWKQISQGNVTAQHQRCSEMTVCLCLVCMICF